MIRNGLALIGLLTVLAFVGTLVATWVGDLRDPRYQRQCLRCGRGIRAPWNWVGLIWKRWHRRRGGACARNWPAEKARRAAL